MKNTRRLLAILLLLASVFTFTVSAANTKDDNNLSVMPINYYAYIENVLPRYLSINNAVQYNDLKISSPIEVVNGAEENGRMFFITNNDSYIGQLSVTYSNGTFHSSFMFEDNEYIDSILSTKTPFAIVAYDDDLIIKTAQSEKMLTLGNTSSKLGSISLSELSTVSFVAADIKTTETTATLADEPYVSLAVSQVANATVNGKGLCWAASVAAVSNYRKGTSYDAMDIYDALNESYNGTPEGSPTWYSRAYSYCNMTYKYTTPMEFSDLYSALASKDRPVIFRVRRSENGSYIGHGIVLRYLYGGNEYATYGFVDPNKTNTVYVDFDDPTCDPNEFVYYNGSRTYPEWIASIY